MKNVLIICTGNSCRSQMAEGILQSFDKRLRVQSAGTRPESEVNPNAIEVMKEIGLDISGAKPKNAEMFINDSFDFVITVCDNAREICPVFTGKVKNRLHIGFEDPADAKGTKDEVINVYRKVRDEISAEFRKLYEESILPDIN